MVPVRTGSVVPDFSGIGARAMEQSAHELLTYIVAKMGDIEKRQIENMEQIIRIQATLDDGLKTKVENLCEEFNEMCKSLDARVRELEQFKWFRDWVTNIRNKEFCYVVMLFTAFIAALALAHVFDQAFTNIMKEIFGLLKGA